MMASNHLDDVTEESTSVTETSSSSGESDDEVEHHGSSNGAKSSTPAIRKDGMAVCEKCGNVGVKHAFYSKTKRFCSLACARSMPKQSGGKTSATSGKTAKRTGTTPSFQNSTQKSKIDLTGSFDWKTHLSRPEFQAAPVWCFKHVPLSKCWNSWINTTVNMKVEIENKDYENIKHVFPCCYWIASVIKVAGYMGLLRYEGFGSDSSKDMWMNLCSEEIHPVGWCASQGKPLIPPKSIEHKYHDWKDFLMRRLTGARTLPVDFHEKVQESLKSRFRLNMKLEVVDKNRISAVRVAKIEEIVGGRLHISYEGAEEWDEGFWCHERSPLIHPIGWAQIVGHDLRASPDYAKASLQKALTKKFDPDDATWDMFEPVVNLSSDLQFKEGMKLEAIDPLNLSTICVATVTRVLRNNYLMIGIDGMMSASGSDWFCYHATSPCIFPVGFCELNNIELTPPRGYKGEFRWYNYLKDTKSTAAPVALFKKDIPNHGFKEGMAVEAVDLMEPRLICVGSITKVVGRLLRVHFDGWDDSYDQWCDCESPDLFPVGWCILVGYRLEPPRAQGSLEGSLRKKRKYQIYRGPRRKKKRIWHQQAKTSTPSVQSPSPFQPIHASMTVKIDGDPAALMGTSADEVIQIGGPLHIDQDSSQSSSARSISHSNPEDWGLLDVAQFLRINECGAYCQAFNQQKINGKKLLSLTKEDIMALTGMKVGPSLKIFDLIQQLKHK